MLVTVVYATDENFVKYTVKSIQSLIKYSNPMNEYEIIILTSNVKDVSVFNKLAGGGERDNITIWTIEPDVNVLGIFEDNKWINNGRLLTSVMFYRLLIPYLIDREWCIYLDGDTLIKCDIADLYYFRDIDYIIAGVYDSGNSGNHKPDYVNSGVLLMNLKYMREIDVMRLFKEYYTPDMYGDQDIINTALKGKIKRIPQTYNLFWSDYEDNLKNILTTAPREIVDEIKKLDWNHPKITHYIWKYKPIMMAAKI